MTGNTAVAKPECEHYWAYHCYDGLSVRLCQLCHEPDWDDLRRQLEDGWDAARDRATEARRDERTRCVTEIFTYADETLAPGIGDVYRDAARLLLREQP